MLLAIPVIASHSDMSQQFSSPKRAQQAIPFGVVVAFMLLAQILMAVPIWNNNVAPEDAVFLGRYTRGYTLVLFANLGLIAIWAILFWQRARFERFLTWIPSIWHYVLIALGLIPVIGLWLFSENDRLIQYATINWVIIAFVLMLTVPDRALRPRWLWLVFAGVLVLLIPLIWSAITGKASFAPHDEAVWADFATSIFHTGGIHFRTFLQDYPVQPGWGIVAVPYGWLLENVAFDGRIGRVIVQIMYLLAFLGIGLVGKYLYNWKVAIVSVALAILSQNFIVLNEFRSHHYMPAVIIFTFLVLLLARRDSKWSGILNFLVGAMVTLSLQVHAIGVMLAVTCSLFYLTELVFAYFDKERKVDLRPIIWFGIGALLGVGVHYVINVAPLGGYGEYLDLLRRDRPAHPMSPSFLTLNFYDVPTLYGRPDPLIRLLTWAGFLFMLWRRNKSDKILLHFVTILLIVTFIMDNIGYPVLYTSFFMIIAGSLLVDAFTTLRDKNVVSLRSFGMTVCVLIALVIPHLLREIHWDTLGNFLTTGDVPTLHDPFVEMGRILQEEYVQEDDIMISGANILWGMPDSEQLVSTEAEYYWKKIYGREYVRQFWDDLNATMYVHFNDTQFDFYLRYHEIDELLAHLQERNFQICDTFTVDPYSVEVYRPNCESAAESE